MTNHHHIAQRYIDAWNIRDGAALDRAVSELYADQAAYVDPQVQVQGHEEIAGLIRAVRDQFPDFEFRLSSPVDAHHDQARFTWDLGPAGAEAPVVGFDVIVTDAEGRISSVLGFIDKAPA